MRPSVRTSSGGYTPAAPTGTTSGGAGRLLLGQRLALGRDEALHSVAQLRSLGLPVLDALQVQAQFLLSTPGARVEKTHLLQAGAALPLTLVGHHDVIKGLVS